MATVPILLLAVLGAALACGAHADGSQNNDLVATYGGLPDPMHWLSFYSLPRTVQLAKKDGWSEVLAKDFDKSYPIAMETLWRNQTLLNEDVYSATALFVAPDVLSEGGRKTFADDDDTVTGLYLQNGQNFWAMPAHAQYGQSVGFEMQGCVKGMGRHFFYGMTSSMPCDEHRPFFLLFDDVTGQLHGFGITLFGKPSSGSWFGRKWFERPNTKLVSAMAPDAPACFQDWSRKKGLAALHVYFKSSPWAVECARN
ncbi:hypothetical protein FOCC_FOCC012318 [Frankliniella occidentalis]|nr:hypothetical protein FOCC_FOCC012318 [Frankliniella occidentalis]